MVCSVCFISRNIQRMRSLFAFQLGRGKNKQVFIACRGYRKTLNFSDKSIQFELVHERLRGEVASFDILAKGKKVIVQKDKRITAKHIREMQEAKIDQLDVPEDFLLVIDESHVTIPQIGGMYEGDRSRKNTLVEYGLRLPSAKDNRPMQFH